MQRFIHTCIAADLNFYDVVHIFQLNFMPLKWNRDMCTMQCALHTNTCIHSQKVIALKAYICCRVNCCLEKRSVHIENLWESDNDDSINKWMESVFRG